MGLSCECPDWGDAEWWCYPPKDFSTLKTDSQKCSSCKTKIEKGSDCLVFTRTEYNDELEEDVDLDPLYMCEECGGLYFALEDLGFCVQIDENMRDLVEEYNEYYAK